MSTASRHVKKPSSRQRLSGLSTVAKPKVRHGSQNAAIREAAKSDPDAQPLTRGDFKRLQRTPRAKVIRQALGLSQETFAERFGIPIGTLRDWEQGRVEPDQAASTYLKVIARNPNAVRKALATTERST
jgi:putative transcriptional regulator